MLSVQTNAQNAGFFFRGKNSSTASAVQTPQQVPASSSVYEDNDNSWAAGTMGDSETSVVEKWQEGIISYQGRNYIYNSKLKVYLLMGVDSDEPVSAFSEETGGGQSDAMFLLIVNEERQELSVISINRNTMTDIDIYNENGYGLGSMKAQICLQHAFGDGRKLSCSRSVNAVSKLFYNLPISGYMAINMGAIPALNDSVGGVEVEVLQDLNFPEAGVKLKEGEVVTLKGKEAYYYLKGRDITKFNSATERLRREEQYIISFMSTLKSASGGKTAKAEDVYYSVADYLVTNLNFADLVENLLGYDFQPERMYTVPGETVKGEKFEEYNVDQEAFYDLIIQIFYQEVNS